MRPPLRSAIALTALVVLSMPLAACTGTTSPTAPSSSSSTTSAGAAPASGTVSAVDLLARLRVAAPDYSVPYDRARFGYGEDFDPDGDGCWTRREVLIRDHVGPLRVFGTCSLDGTWRSLYDGAVWTDQRRLEVDHLVPLGEAWHAGAWTWSRARLIAFGNDLDYRWGLQAVTAAVNQDKENKDPARWLPPENRCAYVKGWIGVKARWGLTVDRAEKAVLQEVLAGCRDPQVERPGTPDVARLAGL